MMATLIKQSPEGEVNRSSSAIDDEKLKAKKNKKKAAKRVHRFYFVKLWPFNDPDIASKISEAENLLAKANQDLIQINAKCKRLRPRWRGSWSRLEQLKRRPPSISNGMGWQKQMLLHLQEALDNINFAHKLRGSNNNSTFSMDQHNNHPHSSRLRILHGSSNLGTERRLLREIACSQQRLNDFVDPSPLLHQFGLLRHIFWYDHGLIDRARYSATIEKIKEIEERKNKALADAIERGQTWNPLSAKRAIEEQIKLVNKISVELKGEHCQVRSEIEGLEKDIKGMEKEVRFLIERRRELRQRKADAQQHLLYLTQQSQQMNGRYNEYLSLTSNVRELAGKKDVAALRKLSNNQVKTFMSEWNWNGCLRMSYEISILPSLDSRGLSRDGRIKTQDQQ